MYTTLPTTQKSAHTSPGCYCYCTHAYHVVHYPKISTYFTGLLLLLYPCIPRCPLPKNQHILHWVAIVTVPMHTTLSTTQKSAHTSPGCYCYCTHVYHVDHYPKISTYFNGLLLLLYPHVVHYPKICTYFTGLLLLLYPCIPRCPLPKNQHILHRVAVPTRCPLPKNLHILHRVAIVTVPMHTTLPTTQKSAHTSPGCCTHTLSTTQKSAHTSPGCYCYCTHAYHVAHYPKISTYFTGLLLSLYPCIPCCPLPKNLHILHRVAIVTVPMHTTLSTTQKSAHTSLGCYCYCTHAYHVVHYPKISTYFTGLLLLLYPCIPRCPLPKNLHILHRVAIVTVPMYTTLTTTQKSAHTSTGCYCYCTHTLSTTQKSAHTSPGCYCYCTHAYHVAHYPKISTYFTGLLYPHVVHYPKICTYFTGLLLLLYPCIPRCPLPKNQHILHRVAVPTRCPLPKNLHILHRVAIVTVPMHTTLPTTQKSAHTSPGCYCHCTHAYHVVHYPKIYTYFTGLLLLLYPCIPRCPLPKNQHILHRVAIVTVPMHTMLSTTQKSAHTSPGCYCYCAHVESTTASKNL